MRETGLKAVAADISFRQCRLFESVGRLASVRRGSEECNLSQPAVTQALGKLEQQIGEVLLQRRASGSYLTDPGKVLHLRVQRLFSQMESALVDLGFAAPTTAASMANRISRSQVRSLTAVIEGGSLAKAAENLELTQASLQRAIRHLEGNLGRSVFHRTSAGVMVTAEGVELGRRLKLAMQEIEWGLHEIEDAKGAQASQIVLGTLPYGGSMLLASVLDEFIRAHPNADVRVLTEGAAEMMRRLRFGEVDLVVGIVQETTNSDLVNETFAHTRFRIVARRDHPLTRKDAVGQDDLAAHDWIVGLEGSSRRQCFENLFADRTPPRARIETSTLPIIRQLIAESDRLTLMTSYELKHESHALVALPYDPIKARPAVGVTMRPDWLPTRVHADFIDLIRRSVQAGAEAEAA
jgi:DNA-binding transcriptional LysR family regulator